MSFVSTTYCYFRSPRVLWSRCNAHAMRKIQICFPLYEKMQGKTVWSSQAAFAMTMPSSNLRASSRVSASMRLDASSMTPKGSLPVSSFLPESSDTSYSPAGTETAQRSRTLPQWVNSCYKSVNLSMNVVCSVGFHSLQDRCSS